MRTQSQTRETTMKLLTILLTSCLAFGLRIGAMAAQKKKKNYRYSERYYYRYPNSVLPGTLQYGHCGLRDHGAPTWSLNLNNTCDNEEFWRRQEERGGHRR